MRVVEGFQDVGPDFLPDPVVTLGTFDGVHRGHQAVVDRTVQWARDLGGPAVVLTFRRHPRRVLHHRGPSLLLSVPRRLALLEALGVDVVVLLDFTPELADVLPEVFAETVLARRLSARGVVLGHDARFGRGGRGDVVLLRRLGVRLGFQVVDVEPVLVGGRPASSSRVRRLVRSGQIEEAARVLGRPVTLEGTVVRGRGQGREIGYPTANLDLHHEVQPPDGVYAGRVHREGRDHLGLVSIGTAPTLGEGLPETVEVHLLDFEGDLYGEEIEVFLLGPIRPQKRFTSLAALAAAITEDARAARARYLEGAAHRS